MRKFFVLIIAILLVGCQTPPMKVTVESQNPTDTDAMDGLIALEIIGGKPPYEIRINDQDKPLVNPSLNSGKFLVQVTDSQGERYEELVVLTTPLKVDHQTRLYVAEHERFMKVSLDIEGGLPPYDLEVDGESVTTLEALGQGTHHLVIQDDNMQKEEIILTVEGLETDMISDHEGNTYVVVKIGDQWWMAENLRMTETATGDKLFHYKYDHDDANLVRGLLYNYRNAMKIDIPGWHVPTHEDFMILETYMGMSQEHAERIGSSDRGQDTGYRLKAGGDSGFDVKPHGWFAGPDNGFGGLNQGTAFITSDLYDEDLVLVRTFMQNEGRIYCYPDPVDWAFYVRLVKNQ